MKASHCIWYLRFAASEATELLTQTSTSSPSTAGRVNGHRDAQANLLCKHRNRVPWIWQHEKWTCCVWTPQIWNRVWKLLSPPCLLLADKESPPGFQHGSACHQCGISREKQAQLGERITASQCKQNSLQTFSLCIIKVSELHCK